MQQVRESYYTLYKYTVITLRHFLNARYRKVLQNAYIQIKLLHAVQISLLYEAIYSI